ncbi:hypothetical protein DSY14_26970 [Nocardiopsis sp. MG754419]|nr:hypothetical protein [Nocardiopsis sp. MG754419]
MPPGTSAPPAGRTPGTVGYWISGGLAGLAALLFAGGVFLAGNPVRAEPGDPVPIPTGESVRFEVASGEEGDEGWMVFGSHGSQSLDCRYAGPIGGEEIPSSYRHINDLHGSWSPLGFVSTPVAGEYSIHCSGAHGMEPREGSDYVLARADVVHAVDTQQLIGRLLVVIGAPLLLIAAIAVAVVTTVRRRSISRRP